MFWTDFLKGLIKALTTIAIIIVVVISTKIITNDSDMIISAFIFCIVGIVVVLSFVSIIGVFTEISDSLYQIKYTINELNNKVIINKTAPLNTTNSNHPPITPSIPTTTANNVSRNTPVNNTSINKWECPECDTFNLSSSRNCKNCGYQK